MENPIESNILGFNFNYPVGIAYDPVEVDLCIANSASNTVYRLEAYSSCFDANITGLNQPLGNTYSLINA